MVETSGPIKDQIQFIDALRNNPQFHLLRMISNPQGDGMDVWIRLRGPNPVQTTLMAVAGVSQVEAAGHLEEEPETTVLRVSIG